MARGTTPFGFGLPSLEASNQAQIDDLVQRNRTLEYTNKKLAEQVALEKAKTNEAVAEAQAQWKLDQIEWRQGCDVLQSCHRVVQLQNVIRLEQERMNVLKEQDVTRKEKLLRLQRDYKITMFQVREAELEDKIRELEEEREAIIADFEAGELHHDQRIAQYETQLEIKDDTIAALQQEKEDLQDAIAEVRETCARLQAEEEKMKRELERVTLQKEGAVTARDELKRANEELTRTKTDMLRQIEKWQTLETKGGAEVESERKKRVALEIKVQDLQSQLETAKEEHEAQLGKEKRRVEKLKANIESLQAASEKHDDEIEAANLKYEKAERKIVKLKAALEVERTRAPSPVEKSIDEEVAESNETPPPDPPKKSKSRPAQTKVTNANAGPSGTNSNETVKSKNKVKKQKALESDVEEISKPKPKLPVEPHDEEVEEVAQKPKSKGKGKAKAVEEDDITEIPLPSEQPKPRRKNKRKATDDDEERPNDDVYDTIPSPPPAKKAKVAPPSEAREVEAAPKARQKPPSRVKSASAQPVRKEELRQISDSETEPTKKKRRKINIFPPQTEPFSFEALGGTKSGLNIPTILSPVKESENVPSRSTSGSVFGSIGSMLKNSFGSRR